MVGIQYDWHVNICLKLCFTLSCSCLFLAFIINSCQTQGWSAIYKFSRVIFFFALFFSICKYRIISNLLYIMITFFFKCKYTFITKIDGPIIPQCHPQFKSTIAPRPPQSPKSYNVQFFNLICWLNMHGLNIPYDIPS